MEMWWEGKGNRGRERRGETGTWEQRNGADKENKGLDTRYEKSCDRSRYETLPWLRDRGRVRETGSARERESV